MRRLRLGSLVLGIFVVLFGLCLRCTWPPARSVGRPLELSHAPPLVTPAVGAFGVVFAAPRGKTVDPTEVTLLFSRPLVGLDVAESSALAPATIVARGTGKAPEGAWRWMGASALIFVPGNRLPLATDYVVTVPAGTRALSGETMGQPFEFAFSTATPTVENVTTREDARHLSSSSAFEARFNQPMDPREVERACSIELGGASPRRIALRATRPDPKNERLVRLAPAAPLPLASDVTVTFDESLRGTDGPLPLGQPKSFRFATFGPLHVTEARCGWRDGPCDPGDSLRVELSNAVSLGDLRAHLRILPPVRIEWPAGTDATTRETMFFVQAHLEPGRTYKVTVRAGVRDEYGQTLARDETHGVSVGDLPPGVAIGLQGTVLEVGLRLPTVFVASVNLGGYSLATGVVSAQAVAALLARPSDGHDSLFDRLTGLPGIATQTVSPSASRNAPSTTGVSLPSLFGGHAGRGAIVVATRFERGGGLRQQVRVANVTDLGLSAKMSRFGSLAWVTHLSDGRPVAGATVAVQDARSTLYEAQTDDDGLAVIPSDRYSPVSAEGAVDQSLLVARKDGDFTWRAIGDALPEGSSGGWIDESGSLHPLGMLFTDRGVYRPGETLKLQAIFRKPEPRGTSTPAGRTISIHASDSQGEALYDGDTVLDAFGAATLDVTLPATAHLGYGSISAKLGGAPDRSFAVSAEIQLAAYKASEFKATVEPAATALMHGEQARFTVRGDYLFGAPMAGAKAHFTATRARASFTPPGAETLVVGDDAYTADLPDRSPRAERLQTGDAVLDGHGTAPIPLKLDLSGQAGPETVTLEAEVQDVSRQTVAASGATLVHPASFYLALSPPAQYLLDKGKPAVASVAALEPSGKRRGGVAVHVALLRRTWVSALESSGENAGHWESHVVDAAVGACDLTTAAAPASCSVLPSAPGYYVVRAVANDERGRSAASSYSLYALGDGVGAGWRAGDDNTLELVPDKKQYEVGDVAKILVKNPVREADALFTVERAGVYTQEHVHLVGAMPTLSVPITDDLRPNAYVSVHMVTGRTKATPPRGPDVGRPSYKAGRAQLVIDPESRRLKVAITPAKKDLRPGDMVDADVAVTDRSGKPTRVELTLWAADEGVLMLTGYRTPDPLPVFTAPRSSAVFSLESRADLARASLHLAELGIDKGDDGGGGGAMRADFRATAWFQGGVLTGDNGHARVRFKLPDNLTTLRLMAVAIAEDDRFGSGDTQLVTSRPLMLRPALPRFLRAGDSLDAGVVVSTKGLASSKVTVTAAVEGLTMKGAATRDVQMPPGGSVEVRWELAAPRAGSAKLTFRASGGGAEDAVQVTKRVDVPTTLEAVELAGETQDAAEERLGKLDGIRDDVGGLDVRVASTALVGVGDGIDQLLQYPYGCTEQLTSRLVPLVMARDLARDFGIALPKDADAMAAAAISKILANQRGDGGFGWWPDSGASDPWVTAYALWGLDASRKAGQRVPPAAIERAADWLHGQITSREIGPERSLQAFALDVLAGLGTADVGAITRLYEARASLSLEDRALLAHAAFSAKMAATLAPELLKDVEAHLRITGRAATVADNVNGGYAPMLDSDARTTALVLRGLLAADRRHPLASPLARGLLGAREHGAWRTTQEAAWALIALDEYRKSAEAEVPNFDASVAWGGARAFGAAFHGRSERVQSSEIETAKLLTKPGAALTFQVDGSGQLYYEARLRYALKDLAVEPLDRGFFVRKLVRGVSSDDLGTALRTLPSRTQVRVPAGGLVLVDLVVVTPTPRDQVVIDDPLPAGLEPVDSSLTTTATSQDVPAEGQDEESSDDHDDAVASARGWAWAWSHREMHDDRVLTFVEHMPEGMYHYRYLARATTLGTYVVPPTKVECMYEPEVFGRNASSHLEVIAP
jgi:alpha-2-macroglobulin